MPRADRRAFLRQLGVGALGVAGGLTSLSALARAQARRRPNFVLILIDDMGWTDLGCYGSDLYRTPNTDRLASEGIRFTDAYSACTVCSPTRAAAMTGKYPARLHVTDWIHGHERPYAKLKIPDWTHYLPLEEYTIAEALGDAGYATCHIGKWHLGNEEHWPEKQGFGTNLGGYQAGQPPSYFSPYKIPTLADGPEGEYLTDREGIEATRFIEEHADRPFFLYLPHYAVHTPLQAKQELIDAYQARITPEKRHKNAKYAGMVESVDDSVGQILAKLDELGLADNTVILFSSDNGGLKPHSTDNSPLRAGKGSSHEGGVRVPLVARGPGIARGGECGEPVITCDFYPTLLDLAGIGRDADRERSVDGLSLTPLFRNPSARLKRRDLFWHYPHYHPGGATPYGAIRARDWKLIEFYEDMHVELYNLREDIGEQNDLSTERPQLTNQLRRRLHAWRESVGAQMPAENPDYDPEKNK